MIRDARDAFLKGLSAQLVFRQGAYTYKSYWKGALPWLHERLNEAPNEKVRLALEEMVSPVVCGACEGRRLRADSLAVRVGGLSIAETARLLKVSDSTVERDWKFARAWLLRAMNSK